MTWCWNVQSWWKGGSQWQEKVRRQRRGGSSNVKPPEDGRKRHQCVWGEGIVFTLDTKTPFTVRGGRRTAVAGNCVYWNESERILRRLGFSLRMRKRKHLWEMRRDLRELRFKQCGKDQKQLMWKTWRLSPPEHLTEVEAHLNLDTMKFSAHASHQVEASKWCRHLGSQCLLRLYFLSIYRVPLHTGTAVAPLVTPSEPRSVSPGLISPLNL